MYDRSKIRNFSIIAHIDHGKSTLADRLLQITQTVSERDMEEQVLDNMDIERERGITIKARAVRLDYSASNGEKYVLNLIDTPGHVDFNYEVSRSLNACEGAVLVVDATQGVEAQTMANAYLAVDNGLEVVPVINKIDLPAAMPERVKHEIEDTIGIPALDAPEISAKNGINIQAVLDRIVSDVPAPNGDDTAPLKCLIFDSYYDSYLGVVVYVRVIDGTLKPGERIKMMNTGAEFDVVSVGYMAPFGLSQSDCIRAGEVGFITASIKSISDTRVGDTVTHAAEPTDTPFPGFKKCIPMVFSGIYPADGAKYQDLKEAILKLQLNDASLTFEPETSAALGFGFRCGFLGLLHMAIIQERLEREFNLDIVTTAPSVIYKILLKTGEEITIDNPLNYPLAEKIEAAYEPMVKATLLTPKAYIGAVNTLCQERRGEFVTMDYIDTERVEIHYRLPLNEIIYDFFDSLKSRSRGYASLDYELDGYDESKLVKLDIMLNGEIIDALTFIIHADKAYTRARKMVEKLKENIPRQLFEIPVQAAIGGKIIGEVLRRRHNEKKEAA